jgi:tetratricopeptide (TPR) repeat protein
MLWAERALAVAPPGVTRWRLLNNLAQLAATHGDPATANRCWNELESEVADADSEGDEFHGLLLSGKATAAMSSGDLVAARAFFEEANPYLERAELWTQLATARMAMGGLLAALGHADSAIATLEAGIEVATAHDDDHSLAMLRLQLGVVAGMHGDHQRVADESARAVESFTALGDANMLGMALLNLGAARSNLKDPAAGEALDDAVAVARRIGDRRLLVLALDARGNLRTGLDDDPRGDAPRDLAGGLADLDEAATTAQLAGLRSEAAKALAGGAAARCAHVPSRDVAATTGEAVRLAAGDPASLASVLGRAASAWAPSEPTRAAALAAAHCRLAAQLGLEPQAHIVNMAAAVDDLDLDVEVLAALAGGDTTAILS